jgi:hypothetical protein
MDDVCAGPQSTYNNQGPKVESAKNESELKKAEYKKCLFDNNRPELSKFLLSDAKSEMDRIGNEGHTVDVMSQFILKQLERETGTLTSLNTMNDIAKETAERLSSEIDDLKSGIRKARRQFLDSSPSASTAVGGFLYFVKEPDNRLMLIFLGCVGAFLTVVSLLIIFNLVPFYMLKNITPDNNGQRYTVVGALWLSVIVMILIGFFTFT